MLTPKQNMLEVIKGGNPDRFVNQYEAVQLHDRAENTESEGK